MQVLSAKNNLGNINMADLGIERNGSIYINQSLCSYYKMLWSRRKRLQDMGRIYSWFGSGGTTKTKFMNTAIFFQLPTQMIYLSIFLTSNLQHFIIVNKLIISCFFVNFSFVGFVYC